MRVIYSFHPDDPVGEHGLAYHGATRRGTKSVMLLSKPETVKLPTDALSIDFINNKVCFLDYLFKIKKLYYENHFYHIS